MEPGEELMSPSHVMHIPGKQFFPLYSLFSLYLRCQGLGVKRNIPLTTNSYSLEIFLPKLLSTTSARGHVSRTLDELYTPVNSGKTKFTRSVNFFTGPVGISQQTPPRVDGFDSVIERQVGGEAEVSTFFANPVHSRVTPCVRIQFVSKCIRPPSVLTKRNFISRGGNKKRSARGNALSGDSPRRCIIKGTVTISVRNEQFQIGACGTKRERQGENRGLSQAPIGQRVRAQAQCTSPAFTNNRADTGRLEIRLPPFGTPRVPRVLKITNGRSTHAHQSEERDHLVAKTSVCHEIAEIAFDSEKSLEQRRCLVTYWYTAIEAKSQRGDTHVAYAASNKRF
ncbi:hypothetical protein ALC60_12489 [Trachymyrmex zeteki]|uniref:Uncharacterized protein n=1 Tax=Mycetomoellerius zeteki TaxID=64791 RepID=A0A151WKM4_9HYME|nr:hypothetical protein ALC60_12489 [Trachymyrmex zeteki]